MPAKICRKSRSWKAYERGGKCSKANEKYIANVTSQKLKYRARGAVFKVRGPVTTSFEVRDGGGGANLAVLS